MLRGSNFLRNIMCYRMSSSRDTHRPHSTTGLSSKRKKRVKSVCPESGCYAAVTHLKEHLVKKHTLKYWGYQCPCGFNASSIDGGLFYKHLVQRHGKDGLVYEYRISAPGGYSDKKRWTCNSHCFTQDQSDLHIRSGHKNTEVCIRCETQK